MISPARKRIIKAYNRIAPDERRSKMYIVRQIATELEYNLDEYGKHGFILFVINKYCISTEDGTKKND